jgi:all-trans-8'-apo-beta-carotenal 15,15'-oxygenase
MPAWNNSLRSVERQHGFEPVEVKGMLPPGLRGTLLRNGPGLLERFGAPYAH